MEESSKKLDDDALKGYKFFIQPINDWNDKIRWECIGVPKSDSDWHVRKISDSPQEALDDIVMSIKSQSQKA